MVELLNIDGKEYLKNESLGVFEVPLNELKSLRPFAIPWHSTVLVRDLPIGDFFTLSVDITHAGGDEALAVAGVSFKLPRGDHSHASTARKIKQVQRNFSPLIQAGWKAQDDQRFTFDDHQWYWILNYWNWFDRNNNDPVLRETVDLVMEAFNALVSSQESFAFICHASEDKSFVDSLAQHMDKKGLDLWYDKREIKVGDSIVERISDGLNRATHLIVVLSRTSVVKSWVQRELSSWLMRQLGDQSIKVLPVLREDCTIPTLLIDIKYADFRGSFDHGLAELVEAISS